MFCTILILKYTFTMKLMYKYVDFCNGIYLGYIIFCLYHFILSNILCGDATLLLYMSVSFRLPFLVRFPPTCYKFSLIKDTFIIIFWGEHNFFQYSFVTICSFCFIIINAKVFQIIFSERNCKSKITVKNHLSTTVTQWLIPPIKYFNWIDVG